LSISNLIFKYGIYYPVVLLRGEWIGRHLKALEKTQYSPQNQIERLQLGRLNRLLQHAKTTVPHYADLPELPLTSLEQLREIPLLEKDFLRNHADQLYSSKTGLLARYKTTGGSTGAPVTLRKDSAGMAHELAATWRGYHWAGIDVGDKQARFWGIPASKRDYWRARLIDFVAHRKRLSAFAFSEDDLGKYFQELQKFKPDYFYGYVSMIRQFADYVERTGERGTLKPKAIVTTAEALTEPDRQQIEKVFECKVFNEYGCGELGTIAHECEHRSLHISAENMIVEVLADSGDPVKVGELGEIVVTDLINFTTPLIRYRLKDYIRLLDKNCRCGLSLPVIFGIQGREYDVLINSKGQRFHGEFFLYMFEDLKKIGLPVKAFKITQNNNNIRLSIVATEENFNSVKSRLLRELKDRFDALYDYTFESVNYIPREPSGKLRLVERIS
jgi:phenylacetate-CoA ligase|tara:strand:+ start:51367 stop:52698 length:1332 start_codon:yes stop_codon:yes gene_type:complete